MPARRISVIIPTFNRVTSVMRAMESALAQTLEGGTEIEVVVVDDGSTDGTRDAVAERFGRCNQVRYIPQSNQGVSAARNRAMREASGEYLAFLDSDDSWMPGKLELQLRGLDSVPEAGLIWTDMDAVDSRGVRVHDRYLRKMYRSYRRYRRIEEVLPRSRELMHSGRTTKVNSGDLYSHMVLGNLIHTSTVLMKRSALPADGWFREDFRRGGEDYEFLLRVCRGSPVAFIDEVTTHYQIGHDDALTHPDNQVELAERFLATLAHTLKTDRERIEQPQSVLDDCLADAEAWVGRELLVAGRASAARAHLLKSLRRAPFKLGLYKFLVAACLPQAVMEPLVRWRRGG